VGSAVATTGHGEHLASAQVTADGRIAAAEPDWAGRSAAALSTRAAIWSARSTELVTRIGEHANDMHASAHCFATNEIQTAADLEAL
jgi:uncharacterized protein YukE